MSERTCSVDGCERDSVARGLCGNHWKAWRKNLTPEEWEKARTRKLPDDERKRRRSESSAKWVAANPEKAKATRDKWLAENPEYGAQWKINNAERVRELNRIWDAANRDKKRESWRRWNAKHTRDPKLLSAKTIEWARQNPAKAQAKQDRYKARKRGAPVSDFTLAQWQELLDEYDHSCAYCGVTDVKLEREHKTPLARGGAHTKANIVPACRWCNARKHLMSAEEWTARLLETS